MKRDAMVPLNPNSTPVEKMVSNYGLHYEVALILAKERPYLDPESILRVSKLCDRASFRELEIIIYGACGTLPVSPAVPIAKRKFESHNSGIQYGKTIDEFARHRYYFLDSNANELISAAVSPEADDLDYASLRFLGLHPWEMPKLMRKHRETLHALLHGKEAKAAAQFWTELTGDERASNNTGLSSKPLSLLSQLLLMIQDFTQTVKYQNTTADNPCLDSDGCSNVPDFNIKSCCDAHDRCYCRGGDDGDRKVCDDELYQCIKRENSSILAAIYRWGVEAFGAGHFNDKSSLTKEEGAPTVINPDDNPTNSDCRIKVTLIEVEYKGVDIGDDWTYSVAVDGESTQLLQNDKHSNGATQYFARIVYDKVLTGRCGDKINLNLSANAKESDLADDDEGSKSTLYQVSCEPGNILTYDPELQVNVKEYIPVLADDLGRLYFRFRIETQCQ